MYDRSIPPRKEALRRAFMLAATLVIGTFIWFLLGDSDSLVAEEPPKKLISEEVLAEVGGIAVTESEVRGRVAEQLAALEAERRRLMESALEERVLELMIEVTAAERGMTPEELLDLEVEQKLDQVPASEVDALLEGGDLLGPEAEISIRRRLRKEALAHELAAGFAVERLAELR